MKKAGFLLVVFCLSACAAGVSENWRDYLDNHGVGGSAPNAVRHCHGYGCRLTSTAKLGKKDWAQIAALFKPRPATPAKERAKIARAIGMLERKIGKQDGTESDQPGTFRQFGNDQLDCVDESTNTTTYLSLLMEKKLIRHHILLAPTARLPIIHAGRWPHQTAVIAETKTGAAFAVDSWFGKNGEDAHIVPLEQWKDGWKPESDDDFY